MYMFKYSDLKKKIYYVIFFQYVMIKIEWKKEKQV